MPIYQINDILLDKYRIERLLGQGAFGEVYLATHIKLNGQRAVKVLRADTPGFSAPQRLQDARERFELEARLYEIFHGSDLVQVFDFEEDHGVLLLSMEYMPGGSLAARIEAADRDRTPMPVDEVVRIGCQIADALAALHQKDVIHRDLHPGNILLDRDGRARLADLGLAQVPGVFSQRYGVSSALLSVHPGHPNFRSPEHNTGSQALKPPSDIYMLGACLFLALTGRDYHNQRPGTRASSLRADTPAWLDDLLISMLAKDPEQRPWDGRELAERLQAGGSQPAKAPRHKKTRSAKPAATETKENSLVVPLAERLPAESSQPAKTPSHSQTQPAPPASVDDLPAQPAKPAACEAEENSLVVPLADGVVMEFCRVPAGKFRMGSADSDRQAYGDEKPQHDVDLDEYWIGKYPVTNRQYQVFVQQAGQKPPEHWSKGVIPQGKENHPVVYVKWEDARAFCAWASRVSGQSIRLPTEAEWEKAARGTDGRIYPWGNQAPNGQLANFRGNEKGTTAVGQYPSGASPYGALDMAGNIWEWVADWYGKDYYRNSPAANPVGPQAGASRVLRGGAWGYNVDLVRTAFRDWGIPNYASNGSGFRCARSQ